jgi:hypothetical protein
MPIAASSTTPPLLGIFKQALPDTERTARACHVQSLGELMPLVLSRYLGVDPPAENAPARAEHEIRAVAG